MSNKYEVQDAPASYKDRLYGKGERFQATKEETAVLVQAGYVKEVGEQASERQHEVGTSPA